ncbi:MAG: hypothetical protein GIW95_02415 [Candidatus Eremiobacteraeota bacterium]|nr:hypothetical protein [Candidatus Eremiobacteraeota bacterium]
MRRRCLRISLIAALCMTAITAGDVTPTVARAAVPKLDAAQGASPAVRAARPPSASQMPKIVLPRLIPTPAPLSPRAAHVAGAHVDGPAHSKKPVHPKDAPADPRAMSSNYRKLHGIREPVSTPTAAPAIPITPGRRSTSSVNILAPVPLGRAAPQATRRKQSVTLSTPSYTGINRWWTYEEDAIPGIGKYMSNVGQGGNLIVQADDMSIPQPGVALAFRRTYNSRSQHDYFGSDGSQISQYGAGWTNTFDAHLASNDGNQYGPGLSVFDIDGARYDYLPDGQGKWIPPAGQFAKLTSDGGNGYYWTKKTGTVYYLWRPGLATDFGGQFAGFAGRLIAIYGRNNNTFLAFDYSFAGGDISCSCNLTDIRVVAAQGGRTSHLAFADFTVQGQPQRLLSTLTWPDGTVVAYSYDQNGNLSEVDQPPNNTYTTQCHGGMTQCRPELYSYNAGGSQLYTAMGPRLAMSSVTPEWTGAAGGGYVLFGYYGAGDLYEVGYVGYMNPTPNDGTNAAIQPGVANGAMYRTVYFSPKNVNSNTWFDTDGHATQYLFDGAGRVTDRAGWNGNAYLWSVQGWDTSNNLISTTDLRGYETDYAYDNSGNTIAVGQPTVTTSQGTFRPTALYSYDANNNVVAFCDQTFTHSLGMDWTSSPAPNDALCPSVPGATLMSWTSTSAQPFGELTQMTKPLGHQIQFSYDPSAQGGVDYGLPTQVSGATVPSQQLFSYNSSGDIITYGKSIGNGSFSTSTLTYDTLSRLTSATDPDNVTSYTYHFANGETSRTETAYQHALTAQSGVNMGALYAYDADGNVISETHHHGCTPGATCTPGVTVKWYDGADRLVEVSQPLGWLTRYLYDFTSGGTVSIYGSPAFRAYGNLFATREYYNGAPYPRYAGQSAGWFDLKGSAFDGLDRQVTKFTYQPCPWQAGWAALCTESAAATIYAYDATASTQGLLSSVVDPLGQSTTNGYDAAGHVTSVSFAGDGGVTPSRTIGYDPDARVVSIASSVGTQTYSYDAEGRKLAASQPLGNGNSAQLAYTYFDNGLKNVVSASMPGQASMQWSWAYRSDGLTTSRAFQSSGGASQSFTYAYSPAGRMTQVQDPYATLNRTYGANGLLASFAVAEGSYSNFTYDPEGSTLGVRGGGQPGAGAYSYNARGELTGQYSYWNGFKITGDQEAFDARNAVTTKTVANVIADCGGSQTTKTFAFDAAGRMSHIDRTRTGTTWVGGDGKIGDTGHCQGYSGSGSITVQHDAENHLLGKTNVLAASDCPPSSGGVYNYGFNQTAYVYGPNGRPASIDGHLAVWDDDELLLTATSAGQVEDVKVGIAADIGGLSSTSQVTIWDRDFAGMVVSSHNQTGHDLWALPDAYHRCGDPPANMPASPTFLAYAPLVSEPGTDGYSDGDIIIQGVRSYDSALGAWTAPDAYAGEVHDPMSQKPYMWNRNNSLDYADPSGYDTIMMYAVRVFGPLVHTFIEVKHHDGTTTRYRLRTL